uniref:Protein kinase domain-containing protein n=1 Tax=Xiphophorus couchianus TaxID=32473 RepID=A0A3B5M125_9TELE
MYTQLNLDADGETKSRGFIPLSLSEIRVIAQQLLVALNALKSAGLVHADIKPDNIMFVNHRSQPLKVKLIDFGLAVKVSKLWFVGTVQAIGYRAPEVILGLKMDESVDMWSLGCSLAYMAIVHIHGYGTQFKSGIYNRLRSLDDLLKTRPSLLKRMLLVDPEVRITPGDALSHRFITMKNFSGERNDSCGASTSKMVTDGKIHKFAVNHYVTSSEEAGRTMEDTAERLPGEARDSVLIINTKLPSSNIATTSFKDYKPSFSEKEQPRRALMTVRPRFKAQQAGEDQTDTAADGRNDEPSGEAF